MFDITIGGFIREGCPYSMKAQKLITDKFAKNNSLVIVSMDEKDDIKHKHGFSTYPHLWLHIGSSKHFFGGCDELEKLMSYESELREMKVYQLFKRIRQISTIENIPYNVLLMFYIARFMNISDDSE